MRPYRFDRVTVKPSGTPFDVPAGADELGTGLGDDERRAERAEQTVPRREVVRRVGEHELGVERGGHREHVAGHDP